MCRDTFKVIYKVTSKEINEAIKVVLRKKSIYHPADKYPIDRSSFGDMRSTWHNLWLIKNPTLRAIRLKLIYKDIWCNEKRFKLGISSDNKCAICGEPETVMHQLFTCNNAKRFWDLGSRITGTGDVTVSSLDQSSMSKQLEVSQNMPNEIIKSVIFKLLIQIDRSKDLNEIDIKRIMLHWINIEYVVLVKSYKNNHSLLANLNSIMLKLVV